MGHEEFPDAFKNQLKKGKDGLLDAHSIPLWKAMELVAELFLKNNPEVEKKFNAMKISRPELMGAMFDEIFEFLEKFYGRVERDPHMLGAVQALKRRFYQLMYQKT